MNDQRSALAQKKFRKKQTEINFLIFIENQNLDLKFNFQFDNEKEKRKKLKIQFHFKTKIECPFRPTDSQSVYRKYNLFFDLKTKRS